MRIRVLVLVVPVVVLVVNSAEAQKPGRIWVESVGGLPDGKFAMVSCIKAGNVIHSTQWRGRMTCDLEGTSLIPTGVYEIRVEGEAVVTELKRGILVTSGNETHVDFAMKEGKGVHIVEYATGPLPREEVTSRLGALEAAVARLTTTLEARMTGTVKKP